MRLGSGSSRGDLSGMSKRVTLVSWDELSGGSGVVALMRLSSEVRNMSQYY